MSFARAKDRDFLRKAATVLESENRRLLREVIELKEKLRVLEGGEPSQLSLRNEELERQLALRNKKLFGDSSEKRSHDRGDEKAERARHPGHGPREQLGLQEVERVHELDAADRVCPQCGGALLEWQGQYEEAEEIDVLEQQYLRVANKRKKYRCACGCIETALAPPRIIAGGRYSVAFAAHVAVSKYADHAPLERQVKIMARHGLRIDSQTLWDQLNALATLLSPAHARLREHLLHKPVLGADETRWRVMSSEKRWQVWAICSDDAVYYQIEDSRSAEAANSVLGDFAGKLLCDGYGVYSALRKRGGRFEIAHCWAHARRKFVEVEELHTGQCAEVLDMIGELYEVERIARDGPAPLLQARARLRTERSAAITERIHRWALEQKALPESPLGRAIGYLGSMWNGLLVFLRDPAVDIDNNDVERALRGVVIGRKNHYGSRSERGTEVAATFYSLVESAKLVGLDPAAYLKAAVDAALSGTLIPLPHEVAR